MSIPEYASLKMSYENNNKWLICYFACFQGHIVRKVFGFQQVYDEPGGLSVGASVSRASQPVDIDERVSASCENLVGL